MRDTAGTPLLLPVAPLPLPVSSARETYGEELKTRAWTVPTYDIGPLQNALSLDVRARRPFHGE